MDAILEKHKDIFVDSKVPICVDQYCFVCKHYSKKDSCDIKIKPKRNADGSLLCTAKEIADLFLNK